MLVVPAKLLNQSQEDIVILHLELKYAEDLYRTLIVRCHKGRVTETRFSTKIRTESWLSHPVGNLVLAPDYVLEHVSVKMLDKYLVRVDAEVVEANNRARSKSKAKQVNYPSLKEGACVGSQLPKQVKQLY